MKLPTREKAIKEIMKDITTEIVIATTGMISREVYKIKDRAKNFYSLGSFGMSLGIALGIALNVKEKVIVIDGDGSVLSSLGTLALHNKLRPKNLWHYILDNNCHSSTGGQPTCSDAVDFSMIAPNTETIKVSKEKGDAPRIPLSPKQITIRFRNAIGPSHPS